MRIRAIRSRQSAGRSATDMLYRRVSLRGLRLSSASERLVGPEVESRPKGPSCVEVDIPATIEARPLIQNSGRLLSLTQNVVKSPLAKLPGAENAAPRAALPLALAALRASRRGLARLPAIDPGATRGILTLDTAD